MKTAIYALIIGVVLTLAARVGNSAELSQPKLPDFLSNEKSYGEWIVKTVQDAPSKSEGALTLEVIKTTPAVYKKTEVFPDGVWVCCAIVKAHFKSASEDITDYEETFCTYDLGTKESKYQLSLPIPESDVKKLLKGPDPAPAPKDDPEHFFDTDNTVVIAC